MFFVPSQFLLKPFSLVPSIQDLMLLLSSIFFPSNKWLTCRHLAFSSFSGDDNYRTSETPAQALTQLRSSCRCFLNFSLTNNNSQLPDYLPTPENTQLRRVSGYLAARVCVNDKLIASRDCGSENTLTLSACI